MDTRIYKMVCIKGFFPFKYDLFLAYLMLRFPGQGSQSSKSFFIWNIRKKLACNPDGNIATVGFVESLRKSAHHSFRRCGDDGHAGLHVLGFVLGLCWLRCRVFFSLRKRMVEMFFLLIKSRGFLSLLPEKLAARP